MRGLRLTTSHIDGITVLAVGGDLDAVTKPDLAARLAAHFTGPGASLILDLSGVTFLDSSGLGLIADYHARAREAGGMLAVAGADRARTRVLWLTGLADWLPVHDDVETARTAIATISR
ncbi:STAS domain-containing protein [Sphaerisporangium corydalis]|uniref:Anti-sigma factor antagonist n=1 Tax=Sphaerisporangium corydalis TaxID=1441875 RepID=A0ABV9ESH9_9ACTN|nr:STAS domain-containing protein [Sphaerisporangium corydalis]